MELKDLLGTVTLIVVIGILIGVGVLVMNSFGGAVYFDRTIANDSFVIPGINNTVTLDQANIQSIVVYNATNLSGETNTLVPAAHYTLLATAGKINWTTNSTSCRTGMTCYAAYTWRDWNSTSVQVSEDVASAMGSIASDWMTILITIIVLGIILTIVVKSFQGNRR